MYNSFFCLFFSFGFTNKLNTNFFMKEVYPLVYHILEILCISIYRTNLVQFEIKLRVNGYQVVEDFKGHIYYVPPQDVGPKNKVIMSLFPLDPSSFSSQGIYLV